MRLWYDDHVAWDAASCRAVSDGPTGDELAARIAQVGG
jgi:hypothetical protein